MTLRTGLKALTILTVAFTIGCSKKADDAAAAVATTDLSSVAGLPKSTDKVTAASGISSKLKAFSAVTGIKLVDVDDSANWGSGTNRAMCELSFMTREILREASSPDRTLCYLGKMQALGKFGTIDDGEYKYFTVTAGGEPMLRTKFKVVKGADGLITNYEMFTCQYSNSTYAQNEYLSETIVDGTATIVAKNVGSQSPMSWGSSTSVTGSVTTAGAWTSKTINSERSFTDGTNSFDQLMTINQGSDYMTISGDNRMSGSATFTMTLYGKVQLINSSSLQTMAFGDGSAKATMTYNSTPIGSAGQTTHWTGDDRITAASSDYATDVAAASLRTDGGTVTVSFTSPQTWDCAAATFETADISESDMAQIQACDSTYGFGSGENGGGYACMNAN